jgi:hypothetical protein
MKERERERKKERGFVLSLRFFRKHSIEMDSRENEAVRGAL